MRENPAAIVEAPRRGAARAPRAAPGGHAGAADQLRAAASSDVSEASLDLERREAQLVLNLLEVLWWSGLRSIEAMRLR